MDSEKNLQCKGMFESCAIWLDSWITQVVLGLPFASPTDHSLPSPQYNFASLDTFMDLDFIKKNHKTFWIF